MRAIRFHAYGGVDVLQEDEIETPSPGESELLVRVVATSVNPVDVKIRTGQYLPPGQDRLPYLGGRDVAGRVERVGAGVSRFAAGDAVFGVPGFDRGAFAEFVILSDDELSPAPARVDLTEAAAVPLAALTAWQGLMVQGKLVAGQRVLIHGGAGGVGHFAVQFARDAGATVFASGSARDADFLRELGAHVAIDYRTERFEEIATDIDLVLDLVGGETQDRSFAVLKRGGTIISAVGAPDATKVGEVGATGKWFIAEPSGRDLRRIAAAIDSGTVKVVVSERFPLSDVAKAQRRLEEGGVRGKILVTLP